jgi:predicted O-methyltransferase YrrM
VFIDADKENYRKYYDMVLDKVQAGGVIIADNVLWSGKVLNKGPKKLDKDTKALIEFNDYVQQDDRVENVLFPVRDGLMMIRKK